MITQTKQTKTFAERMARTLEADELGAVGGGVADLGGPLLRSGAPNASDDPGGNGGMNY